MSRKPNFKTSKNVNPVIYAYTTPGVIYHDGWIKIGYTERDVDERIKEQTKTADIRYQKEWVDSAVFSDGITWFKDTEFHAYLARKGVKRKDPQKDDEGYPEWFEIGSEESHQMLEEFKVNKGVLETLKISSYHLRKEQEDAVNKTLEYFKTHEQEHPEFLWNAKPRFGKTLSTYELCKRLDAKIVLIVTNRPAIANSWYDDYEKFMGTESGYYFISNVDELKGKSEVYSRKDYADKISSDPKNKKGLIEFVSLQDLKGSRYFGGGFDKLSEVKKTNWDLLVIDEAHEGVDTYKTDVAFDQIKRKYTLHLSGTPFKALANEKFPADAIYNWTYADEQKAKRDWDNSKEEENPYEVLPRLNLYTYKMSDIVEEKVKEGADFDDDGDNEEYYWNLNEFFKTKKVEGKLKFVHEESVEKFLDALTTQTKFPFSTPELRNELKHSIWILKYVDSAKALAEMLQNHPVFKEYKIVLAAGDGKFDEEGNSTNDAEINKVLKKSYARVVDAIKNNDKTITLSVGQLTTGITIPEWTGVLMLSQMESPTLYFQAAFRAQNPCLFTENGKELRKTDAYVFDFDPARTLKIFEEFANNLNPITANGGGDLETRKENVRELLNFFPVYGEDDDGEMIALDDEKILTIPRTIHAKEVVRKGFMSNFLFQNISNIFHAPKEVLDAVNKMHKGKSIKTTTNTGRELNINEIGDVEIPPEEIIGTATNLFGPGIYEGVGQEVEKALDESISKSNENQKSAAEIRKISDKIKTQVIDNVIKKGKDNSEKPLPASGIQNIRRKLYKETDDYVNKVYGNYSIEKTDIETKRKEEIENSFLSGSDIDEINNRYDEKQEKLRKDFIDDIKEKAKDLCKSTELAVAETIERSEKEKERNDQMSDIRENLRGFSRTIPSFLMAYGDEDTTLKNFDQKIPNNEVFEDLTGISLDEFKLLRDGFDSIGDNGETKHYDGFFDEIVFNDSIQEFLKLKKNLSNYFDDNLKEDIFDYIPPQKTNQIFTPKKVVIEMVDALEKENPDCFSNPNYTFIDLYMKSGLYIAEIVKRLYKNKTMKELYPNDNERLNHIFAKQVYGLAPTDIIYNISRNYLLGFSDHIKIDHDNIRLFDTLPSAQKGTLEKDLDNIFNSNNNLENNKD